MGFFKRPGFVPAIGATVVAASIVVHFVFYPAFVFAAASRDLVMSVGIGLVALGAYVVALSGTRIVKAARGQEMVTNGPFAVFLNPIYGAVVLFVIPGAALILQSWLVAATAPATYLLYRIFARREEQRLIARFGEGYLENRRRRILPKLL